MISLQPLPPGLPKRMGVVTGIERWRNMWTKVGAIKDLMRVPTYSTSLSWLNT